MVIMNAIVGTPLIDFIFATCCVCVGMTLGVFICCLYIKCSSKKVSDAYAMTDIHGSKSNLWAEACSGASSSPPQRDLAQECCTIYVPDVGLIL